MLGRVVFLAFLVFLGLCSPARAEDCGVRGNDGGTEVVQLDCQDAATFATSPSPLKIRTPPTATAPLGEIRGLTLVTPGDIGASKFRVRIFDALKTPSNIIKAIGVVSSGTSGMTPCEELQMIGYHPDPKFALNKTTYQLGSDIDCSATNPANTASINCSAASTTPGSLWKCGYAKRFNNKGVDGNPDVSGSPLNDDSIPALEDLGDKGFKPLGCSIGASEDSCTNPFTGRFDGKGYPIIGLTINRETNSVGLFGGTSGATITGVGLIGESVSGVTNVGGLVGLAYNSSTINNSYASGTVSGWQYYIGGLVGQLSNSTINNSYGKVTVTGPDIVGGLVGVVRNLSTINNSYASGAATANTWDSGGLVGACVGNVTINNSYATGTATGNAAVGGLVGLINSTLSLNRSFAAGDVLAKIIPSPPNTAADYSGALVGQLVMSTFSATKVRWDKAKNLSSVVPCGVSSCASANVLAFTVSGDAYDPTKEPLRSWDPLVWEFRKADNKYPKLKNVGGTQ